jgi:antibiotic biosynthesis monooxygenase (ABM) superfamily enzyme
MSGAGTTIVTQTRPAPDHEDAFAAWQTETSRIIAGFAGFVRQTVIPPSPPTQVDWLILQHFVDHDSAVAWLKSDARQARATEVQALVVGHDDIHLVAGDGSQAMASPVSAVISTRIKPGQESAYLRWEQRIAAAQAQSPGFQGYRLEPPIPGVQDDWLAIVRFDTDENLKVWLNSRARQELLKESVAFTAEFHTRIARTGFDQWFDVTKGHAAAAPAWKQNMLVLLMLYPVVFLFGTFVQTPWLMGRWGIAFPVALFIGNLVSIVLLNYLVPWTSRRFQWWLQAAAAITTWSGLAGVLAILALYAIMILAFFWLL